MGLGIGGNSGEAAGLNDVLLAMLVGVVGGVPSSVSVVEAEPNAFGLFAFR